MPIVAIALVALGERPIGPRTPIRKAVALTILSGGKASAIAAALTLALIGRSVAEGLRGVWREARLRLKPRLGLLVSLPLRRRSETIRQPAEIAIVVEVVIGLAGRSLLAALCQRLSGLSSRYEPEIVLRVLQIILGRDRISAGVGVPRELQIFLGHMMRVAAYFNVRSIRTRKIASKDWGHADYLSAGHASFCSDLVSF